jgi:hypothetical protein
VNNIFTAFKLKYLFDKFNINSFVLAYDLPKNKVSTVINNYKSGIIDCIILMHDGYSKRPKRFGLKSGFKNIQVDFILNFDLPKTYN